MALSAELRDTFGEDEDGNAFDLEDVLNGVVVVMRRIGPALPGDVNVPAILEMAQSVSSQIGSADTSRATAAAGEAGSRAAADIASLPGADVLLRPLVSVIENVESVTQGDSAAMLTSLRDAARGGDEGEQAIGLDALSGSLGAVFRGLRSDTPAGAALQQLVNAIPGGGQIGSTIDTAITGGAGVHELVSLVGGLMSVRTCADDVDLAASRTRRFLRDGEIREALLRARTLSARAGEMADALRAAPADGPGPVADALAERVERLIVAYYGLAEVIGGMAQGEATLVDAGLDALVSELAAAERKLGEHPGHDVRALMIDLQQRAAAVLPAPAGPQPSSLDELWNSADAMVGTFVNFVNNIPVDQISGPVSDAIGQVTSVVTELNRILAQIEGAIRGVFEQARQLVQAIDTQAIAEAIRVFLEPVVAAVTELERVITAAMGAISDAVIEVTNKINDVKNELLSVQTLITGAFSRISQVIDDLDIEDLIEDVRGKVTEAAAALDRFQLSPYFDTAIEVMDTTASVVDAVPIGILPEAEQQKVRDLARPIKEIDFDAEVRTVLRQQLDAILTALDDDVLGEVQNAFDEVATFLREIDPETHLTRFEEEQMLPFIEQLRALDPDALLRPVTEAIDGVRTRIATLDIREEVLGVVERAFDEVLQHFDALNPATLLEPVEQRIDDAREQVISLIGLDQWMEHIDTLAETANDWLDRIDLAAASERLDALHDLWLAETQQASGAVAGGLVAMMLSGSDSRLRASAYPSVARWIGGDDGAGEIRASIAASRAKLEETRAIVAEFDLAALGSEFASAHRTVSDAVAALPGGNPLALRLAPALAAAAPATLFGAQAQNQARYAEGLDAAIATLRTLESGGFSHVASAATGLRDGLRPLAAIRDQLISHLRRFGIDAVGKDMRQVIREIFNVLRPSRALAPLVPLVTAIRNKLRALLVDGLVTPIRAGVTAVREVFDHLDISPLREGLNALHAQIRTELNAFRPSVILGDLLTAVESLQARLASFDPLAPIRITIQALKTAIDEIALAFRPTVLFAPVLVTYDEIVELVDNLNVSTLLQPVLDELRDLATQLDEGLGRAGESFATLQEALP
jgi:hypothetical protein